MNKEGIFWISDYEENIDKNRFNSRSRSGLAFCGAGSTKMI
jgi:hypothetical protein